jgi:hypothetical protein
MTTAEDGLTLSLSLVLDYPGQEPHASIRYVGNMVDLSVTLDYRVNDLPWVSGPWRHGPHALAPYGARWRR